MAGMDKRCSCGNDTFSAFQNVKRSVIVNRKREFLDEGEDGNIEVTSEPYGPYECTRCGKVYKSLEELPDYSELQRSRKRMAEKIMQECVDLPGVYVLSHQDAFSGLLVTDNAAAYGIQSNLDDEKLFPVVAMTATEAGMIFQIKDAD